MDPMRPSSSIARRIGFVVGAAVVAMGCTRERGRPYACTCSVLTDFDDGTRHVVEVCSPSGERAAEFGKGCAQSGAPAKVEACVCRPIEGPACDLGRCVTRPR